MEVSNPIGTNFKLVQASKLDQVTYYAVHLIFLIDATKCEYSTTSVKLFSNTWLTSIIKKNNICLNI